MEEIWKDIKGYERIYQVSNLGRVRSLKFNKERILKATLRGQKKCLYLSVALSKNGKVKIFDIHRLVAQTFIENPNNYNIINHKDENRLNNRVDNLEWCTHSYNVKYSTHSKRCKNYIGQYDLDDNLIKKWQSSWEVMKTLNLKSRTNIDECCKNKRKTAYGYKWRYLKDANC